LAKTHIVEQGEHLSSIARLNGFQNFHSIWDHPNNAALKAKRDPHVLVPGDRLFIPDREQKTEPISTGALHIFAINVSTIFLRLRLLDINGKPLNGIRCDAFVSAGIKVSDSVTTDGKGILADPNPLDPTVRTGQVLAHIPPAPPAPPKKGDPPPSPGRETILKWDLRIGDLNPVFKLSGQQARFNNMGYFAGFTLKDLDQFLWAAEEFECDQIAKPVKKRPDIVPAPKEGEDNKNNPNPDAHTGITEQKVVGVIEKVHGI
jgi:hypothetical protein